MYTNNMSTKYFNKNRFTPKFMTVVKNQLKKPNGTLSEKVNKYLAEKNRYYNKNTGKIIKKSTLKMKEYKGYKIDGRTVYNIGVTQQNTKTYGRIYHRPEVEKYKNKGREYFYTEIKAFFRENFDQFFKNKCLVVLSMYNENIYGKEPDRLKDFETGNNKSFKTLFNGPFISKFFMYSHNQSIFDTYDYVKITITKITELTANQIQQNFLDSNISHCTITPIKAWAMGKISEHKSASTKKIYNSILNKLLKYEVQYSAGIPEKDLQSFCDDLCIDMTVSLPMGYSKYGSNLIQVKTTKKTYGLKHFKFINTRWNHLDILTNETNKDITVSNKDEMLNILNKIREQKRTVAYKTINGEIIRINDIDKNYRLKSTYNLAVEAFEKENNLNNCFLYESEESTSEQSIIQFIKLGVHFNLCVDVNNSYVNNNNSNYDDVKHIDMEKAYFNYKKCDYYDGFLWNPSEFRVCDIPKEDAIITAGYYMINNVCLKNCKKIIHTLNFIHNYGIYTSPEIKFFGDIGAKFDIIAGVWGTKRDINMGVDMTVKLDKIPHYSRWVGAQAPSEDNENYMYNSYEFDTDNNGAELISNMAYHISKNGVKTKLCMNDYHKKITIKFKKAYMKTRRHITGYITAYQRISTIIQLLEFEHDDIIRVCVDGIYYHDNGKYKNIKLKSSFIFDDDREGKKAENYISLKDNAVDSYISNGSNKKNVELITARRDKYVKYYENTILTGAGGTGKTYNVCNDKAYSNIVYLAHSKNLCANKYIEFKNIKYAAPYHHLICGNTELLNIIKNNHPHLIFCDEVSTYGKKEIEQIIKICSDMCVKVIFAGDIGYQCDPFSEKVKSTPKERLALFSNIQNCDGINYRFRGDPIHDKCMKDIRILMDNTEKMTDDEQIKIMIDFLIENKYKTCNKEYVIKNHKIDDMILCTCHTYIHSNEYKINNTNKFKHIKKQDDIKVIGWGSLLPIDTYDKKKYRINKNNKSHNNGQIIITNDRQPDNSNEQYAFTVHSIQGMSHTQKLYIDCRALLCPKVLYTAISRCTTRDNIYLVV